MTKQSTDTCASAHDAFASGLAEYLLKWESSIHDDNGKMGEGNLTHFISVFLHDRAAVPAQHSASKVNELVTEAIANRAFDVFNNDPSGFQRVAMRFALEAVWPVRLTHKWDSIYGSHPPVDAPGPDGQTYFPASAASVIDRAFNFASNTPCTCDEEMHGCDRCKLMYEAIQWLGARDVVWGGS